MGVLRIRHKIIVYYCLYTISWSHKVFISHVIIIINYLCQGCAANIIGGPDITKKMGDITGQAFILHMI